MADAFQRDQYVASLDVLGGIRVNMREAQRILSKPPKSPLKKMAHSRGTGWMDIPVAFERRTQYLLYRNKCHKCSI